MCNLEKIEAFLWSEKVFETLDFFRIFFIIWIWDSKFFRDFMNFNERNLCENRIEFGAMVAEIQPWGWKNDVEKSQLIAAFGLVVRKVTGKSAAYFGSGPNIKLRNFWCRSGRNRTVTFFFFVRNFEVEFFENHHENWNFFLWYVRVTCSSFERCAWFCSRTNSDSHRQILPCCSVPPYITDSVTVYWYW